MLSDVDAGWTSFGKEFDVLLFMINREDFGESDLCCAHHADEDQCAEGDDRFHGLNLDQWVLQDNDLQY